MINNIHIYDMDGTIVDSSHRYRTITKPDGTMTIDLDHWRAHDTREFILKDKLLPLAEQYKADLKNPETYVVIATARAIEYGDANYQFVLSHLGLPDKFIYRQGAGDSRGGADLKIAGIKPLLNLRQFRNAAIKFFEDNIDYLNKVCEAINAEPVYIESNQGY